MQKKQIDKFEELLQFINEHPKCSSSEILKGIKTETSISTLKRALQTLVSEGLIHSIGDFKSRKYEVSIAYDTIRPIDVEQYFDFIIIGIFAIGKSFSILPIYFIVLSPVNESIFSTY